MLFTYFGGVLFPRILSLILCLDPPHHFSEAPALLIFPRLPFSLLWPLKKVFSKAFYTLNEAPDHAEMSDLESFLWYTVLMLFQVITQEATGPLPGDKTQLILTAWVTLLCKCLEPASKVVFLPFQFNTPGLGPLNIHCSRSIHPYLVSFNFTEDNEFWLFCFS